MFLGGPSITFGQAWTNLVPLESKCEDVKRVFSVRECTFPVTNLEMPGYDVTIHFSQAKGEWKVPADTVTDIRFFFNDLVRLRDFETDFADYKMSREVDTPAIMIYLNEKKGIKLWVQTAVANEPYISSLFLLPSQSNARKYRCR